MKLASLFLLAGCWTSSPPTAPPTAPDVRVELAAVTLGDDCDDVGSVVPPVASRVAPDRRSSAGAPMPPADICEGCMPRRAHCDQTSMQLAVRAAPGAGPTAIAIKRVELLDQDGSFLANLEARRPSKWSGDHYVAWDQRVASGEALSTSYLLDVPDWDALAGGRWNAHTKTFQLRVTLTVGATDRVVDRQAIIPARLEPPVPT